MFLTIKFGCGLNMITCEVRRSWLCQGQPDQKPARKILHLIMIWRMFGRYFLEDVWEIFGQVTAMRPQFLKWAAG